VFAKVYLRALHIICLVCLEVSCVTWVNLVIHFLTSHSSSTVGLNVLWTVKVCVCVCVYLYDFNFCSY